MKNFLKRSFSPKTIALMISFVSQIKLIFFKKDIGKGSYIDPTVNVLGWAYVSIGKKTLIGEQSWLNINGRKEGFKHIKIGNFCYVGRRNFFSSSKELIMCDFVMTNNECKFLGSNHVFDDPRSPYISTGTTNDEVQKIGVNCWIGTGSTVLGNVEIGYGSIIGAGSVVTKDIPPFSIAVGNPCKVIKRYDFEVKEWIGIDCFDSKKEAIMPTEERYLKDLHDKSRDLMLPVMAATSRYGDLY